VTTLTVSGVAFNTGRPAVADDAEHAVWAAALVSLNSLRMNKTDLGACDYFRGVGHCSGTGGLCAVIGEPLCMTEGTSDCWPSENESNTEEARRG
jgi:hypothetical protein